MMEIKSIAVDLDGTLAEYHGWKGNDHIGDPIPEMMDRVHKWIAEGHEVSIFTARVSGEDSRSARFYIRRWLQGHNLDFIPITCIKDKHFDEFWDDRAIRIERNTGKIL